MLMSNDDPFERPRDLLEAKNQIANLKVELIRHSDLLAEANEALADVRTLDDWRSKSPERTWLMSGDGWAWCRLYDHGVRDCQNSFDGATPDEARAKAAAWVREQAKP
jgi:hypothetical protein